MSNPVTEHPASLLEAGFPHSPMHRDTPRQEKSLTALPAAPNYNPRYSQPAAVVPRIPKPQPVCSKSEHCPCCSRAPTPRACLQAAGVLLVLLPTGSAGLSAEPPPLRRLPVTCQQRRGPGSHLPARSTRASLTAPHG